MKPIMRASTKGALVSSLATAALVVGGLVAAPAAHAAIPVAPAPGAEAVNIAATGTVTASSFFSENEPGNANYANYLPSNVLTAGSPGWVSRYPHAAGSGWLADTYTQALTDGSWINIEFPTAVPVSEVIVDWTAQGTGTPATTCPNIYKVLVSADGTDWTEVDYWGREFGACTTVSLTKQHSVAVDFNVKHVRISSVLTANSARGVAIDRIQVFGRNNWAWTPTLPASWSVTDVKNVARLAGNEASAKSQPANGGQTSPVQTPSGGTQSSNWNPERAIDGIFVSRWQSNYSGWPGGTGYDNTTDWYQVWLAEASPVYQLHIDWAGSNNVQPNTQVHWPVMKPTRYSVEVATNNACNNWTTVARVAAPAQNDDVLLGIADPVKCVRVSGVQKAVPQGYAIGEFEIWNGPRPANDVGVISPLPVSQTPLSGAQFELTAASKVFVSAASLLDTGELLAAQLRPATGFAVPVAVGTGGANDITLNLGAVAGLPTDALSQEEGYTLTVNSAGAVATAPKAHGLFNAFQTIRQVLPTAIFSQAKLTENGGIAIPNVVRKVAWTADPIRVFDYPRLQYRGQHIDSSRNFISVTEFKTLVDQFSAMKLNTIHIHLTDSQSFRVELDDPPQYPGLYSFFEPMAKGQLTSADMPGNWTLGSAQANGCNGSGCRNGWYTKADLRDMVAYASAHFVTIIPEMESPGHAVSNMAALIAGGDKQDPKLTYVCPTGTMTAPPTNFCMVPTHVAYTNGLAFWDDVIKQMREIFPGPIFHMGGDEVSGTSQGETQANYQNWIAQVEKIAIKYNYKVQSWTPGIGGYQDSSSVCHLWGDYPTSPQWVSPSWYTRGFDFFQTPEWSAYLDFAYSGSGGRTPVTEAYKAYNWDPEWFVDKYRGYNAHQAVWGGPSPESIIGIAGANWSENYQAGENAFQYMLFPRISGNAEKGWTPKEKAFDWKGYNKRVALQGSRWSFAGVNFGPAQEHPWTAEAAGTIVKMADSGAVNGLELAGIAAPGYPFGLLTATVNWGDGTSSAGAIAGRDWTVGSRLGRILSRVSGTHTYAAINQKYQGTVKVTAPAMSTLLPALDLSIPFTVMPAQASAAELAVLDTAILIGELFEAQAGRWTAASYAPFLAALDAARALRASNPVAPELIGGVIAALTDAQGKLEDGVSVTGLLDLIAQAEAMVADPAAYVPTFMGDLATAIAHAKALAAGSPTQVQVLDEMLALSNAMAKVLERGDKTALLALIALAEGLVPAQFAPVAWAPVATALAAAKVVAADVNASFLQVDAAFANLQDALGALALRSAKAGLQSAVDVAKSILDSASLYVPSTLVGLKESYDNALVVLADLNATVAGVSAAQSDLIAKIAAARLVPTAGSPSAALLTPAGAAKAALAPASVAAAAQAAKFAKTAKPQIVGVAKVGSKLVAKAGKWSPKPTLAYQWFRNGKAIAKATKATYKVKAKDAGKRLTVKVKASKAGFASVVKQSAKTKKVAK